MAERANEDGPGTPVLEHYPEQGGPVELVDVSKLPFTLGRGTTHDRPLYSVGVSRDHAVIVRVDDGYAVRDLGSTNGTFVNGERVVEARLSDGDIIHLAGVEFRFRVTFLDPAGASDALIQTTMRLPSAPHDSLIVGTQLLQELIEQEAIRTLYQPIVSLATREVVAFEALGRGTHPGLSERPATLLQLAERCGLAVELSRLFRRRAMTDAARLPSGSTVFLNVHPRELIAGDLVDTLVPSDPCGQDGRFVLEIAESSVTDALAMSRLRDALRARGYGLAYDDFGAGQARLLELSDVPPDYLKLDRGVIEGIDRLAPRQQLVRAIVEAVGALGVHVIAEGIETAEVAQTCADLGCDLGQGYFLGNLREW